MVKVKKQTTEDKLQARIDKIDFGPRGGGRKVLKGHGTKHGTSGEGGAVTTKRGEINIGSGTKHGTSGEK